MAYNCQARAQQVYENEEDEYANNIYQHRSTDSREFKEAENIRMYYDNTNNLVNL